MKKYIIFGAGSFLSDLFDLIHSNNGRVAKIYQNVPETRQERVLTLKERVDLLGYDVEVHTSLDSFVEPTEEMGYALGCLTVQKYKLVEELRQRFGIKFDSLVHPSVLLGSNNHIGEGVLINTGTVTAPNVYLDDFCSINRSVSIGHDTKIGRYSQISPCVSLSGSCQIGKHSFIGIGASVLDRLTIGDWSIIGAGSIVTRDIDEAVIAFGAPAKKIRENKNRDFATYQATLSSS